MNDPRRRRGYRYRGWSGGPDPLAPPYDVRQALDAVGEEVLRGGSLREALRDLLRRGLPDPTDPRRRAGLDELRARAQRLRREALRRGRLDGALTRAAALLDQAVAAERDALQGDSSDEASFARTRLDALPRSTAAAVSELSDYRWRSPEAEAAYRQILEELRADVVDRQFAGLREALESMGRNPAEADAALGAMLGDLNELLEKRARGEDTPEDFEQFMAEHGDLFPEDPRNLDELIDALARRAAAGARLMASLTPQQRAELADLMAQALGDSALAEQMARLGDNLNALRPDLARGRPAQMNGENPLGLGEATNVLGELSDLEDLLQQLGQEHPGATLDDIDVTTVERALGPDAATDVRALQQLERELTRQGWLQRGEDGPTLSPKALRRLGQTALRQVFDHLREGGRGGHDTRSAGPAGEATGATRAWRFGDHQPLDVVRTVGNALRRSPGVPVQLQVEDFEVVETENRAGAAVALCVDLSFSMVAQDRWGPMKQTALALAHLIATRYPQDRLQIIGFGRYAEVLTPEQLAAVEADYTQGTNLQHALHLAARHLRRHPDGEPVVLVVTDGEPTAHLAPNGQAFFAWPTTQATVRATIAEVDRLTSQRAAINVFMLGDDPGLHRFMDAVAQRNGGRMFTPDADRLGAYVVDDYVRARGGGRPH